MFDLKLFISVTVSFVLLQTSGADLGAGGGGGGALNIEE